MGLHNHHNHQCEHDDLRYCKHCDVAYCEDCGKEWKSISYSYTLSTTPSWTTHRMHSH